MAVGDAVHRELPMFAIVVGDVNVRLVIIEAMAVNRRIRGAGAEMPGFDNADLRPWRELGRRDVRPVLATVARDPDIAVIGAGPEQILLERRGRELIHHAALRTRDRSEEHT